LDQFYDRAAENLMILKDLDSFKGKARIEKNIRGRLRFVRMHKVDKELIERLDRANEQDMRGLKDRYIAGFSTGR
jgi:hypothetical protein